MKLTTRAFGPAGVPGRTAFTLVELLISVIIMAILTGLIVGAAIKFKDAQVNSTTDGQLTRLQVKLRADYKEVVQKCYRDPIPPEILTFCNDDKDRARAVHTAATLRIHFPETFVEATTSLTIGSPPNPPNYRAKSLFKAVSGVTPLPGGATTAQIQERAMQERAALLYLILTERAVGGGVGDENGMSGEKMNVNIGGKDFTVFKDTFGMPIVYYRWAQNQELEAPPFARSAGNDPLDPTKKVSTWSGLTTLKAIPQSNLHFDGVNRVPTVVSFGKDKTFDNWPTSGGDDRVGYRLERLGNKGDLPSND